MNKLKKETIENIRNDHGSTLKNDYGLTADELADDNAIERVIKYKVESTDEYDSLHFYQGYLYALDEIEERNK